MISGGLQDVANHLWQSTLFAVMAGSLTMGLRKNRAEVRYWVWFAASVKFLIPFSILVDAGRHFGRHADVAVAPSDWSAVMEQVSVPFAISASLGTIPATAQRWSINWTAIVCAIWLIGFVALVWSWLRRWRRMRVLLRTASPLHLPIDIQVLTSPVFGEPGVFGISRPVLLLPERVTSGLTAPQLQGILAHELCHVRRRDNLTSAIHMAVEAVFWFHPLVWWIGAQLMEERERACDEEVLRAGTPPQAYAEGILRICELYLESPLRCVAGVTGGNLRKRIEAIMTNRIADRLGVSKKIALAAAAAAVLIAPIGIGVANASALLAQSPAVATPKFEAASIRPCAAGDVTGPPGGRGAGSGRISWSPGRLKAECATVDRLIREAYLRYPDGKPWPDMLPGRTEPPVSIRSMNQPIKGSPAWIGSDKYTIEAETPGAPAEEVTRGPMLQALLEERFRLKLHRENKEVQAYELTAAAGGPKLHQATDGNCIQWDHNQTAPLRRAPEDRTVAEMPCGLFIRSTGNDGLDVNGTTIASLCRNFSVVLDGDVIDRTGIEGVFDIHLDIHAEPPDVRDPSDTFYAARAALQKLGLKLERAKGSREFLVIDSVARPSEN